MKILSNIHSNNIKSLRFIGAVLLFLSTTSTPLYADIVIKGDVYGGGRQGAVGTGNTTTAVNAAKESVAITDATYKATNITVNAGQVRTVFGGGQEGRTFGSTDVQVNAGEIGSTDWEGTIHGGLFGAGDGNGALVFGGSNVEINGGTIVQNVYGGGNEAELIGTTNVNLKGGDLQAAVYGGARVANIYGYSLVNVNGAEAANDMIIGAVYGGNDIAGNITIPNGTNWSWIRGNNLTLPTLNEDATKPISNNGYGIDKSWNAFVVSSHSASHKVYVAQLYGGGNGEYNYTGNPGNETMSELNERVWNSSTSSWDISAHSFTGLASRPEVSKVYLELKGGNFGYVYGGGNNATVTSETVICLNNTTEDHYTLNADKMRAMGINLDVDKAAYKISGTDATPKYQFDRVFGGNKNADMAIHPKWHLNQGTINALYSGGDAGDMTYENGLMLVLSSPDLEVNNVYGGCRRADVIPSNLALINNNEYEEPTTGIKFPQGYSARVLVTAGTIGNVYGGNDISGDVFGGNAIEIRSSITGSVYGGGNGSYVYTDKESLANDPTYGDFYYANYSDSENTASVNSLNKFRPHTSKSYIHVAGTENAVTVIDAVYGGGNSATVSDAINLVLGTYTQIGNVFLGSNGLDMVNKKTGGTLNLYKTNSNLDLTKTDIFNTYMQGAAVSCMPVYTFDDSYPRTYDAAQDSKYAHIGSFYCGGNVGSMTSAANFDISFAKPIIITNKLVGGCNDAFVEETAGLNARNEGGFTVKPASGAKIHLAVNGVIFANSVGATAGNQGNIFGGCFNSGIINGDVVIDLLQNIIPSSSDINTGMDTYLANSSNLFNTPFSVFGGGFGKDATIKGNTTININGNSVSEGKAFKVFGGGYGGTIDGNTTVSLVKGEIGKLYGGGFEGPVTGNTALYLTGGSVYDTFGGSCNADIDGYAQTFAGTGLNNATGSATIRNNIYGGNDFGGSINGFGDFYGKVTETGMVYNPSGAAKPAVTQASAYVEYVSGVITNYIFGGSCGNYDYNNDAYTSHKNSPNPYPFLGNAFVNFKPNSSTSTTISKVFGAGQGYSGESASASEQDKMQNRSYVHVDIPEGTAKFNTTEFFGAGAYSGIGMGINPSSAGFHADSVSAVIDLVRGEIKNAYGGGYEEGVTRRTVVNVPVGSKIKANEIFGGAYGVRNNAPCDVYESQVNYRSDKAVIEGVFGGNNNKRRTLYAHVNIYSKALASSGNNPPIFGAGKGEGTWAQYTEVNLMHGAGTYNVYGGGNAGRVLNIESVKALTTYTPDASETAMGVDSPANYYRELGTTWYRDDVLDPNQIHTHTVDGETIFTNTNVNINKGATGGYIYGAGLGPTANVSGSTFIHLNGGNVTRDIYGSGSQGSVLNKDKLAFKAQTWVYAEGGTARNL